MNNIITEAKKINHCLSNKPFDIKTPRTETHRRGINIIPAPLVLKNYDCFFEKDNQQVTFLLKMV